MEDGAVLLRACLLVVCVGVCCLRSLDLSAGGPNPNAGRGLCLASAGESLKFRCVQVDGQSVGREQVEDDEARGVK